MKKDKSEFDSNFMSDFRRFLDEFKEESDRAAVILGAAKLDIQLFQLLTKHLRTPPSSHDELFDGDSPLGTFSAKINLTYRLGLIDNEFTRALHLIRRIRNSFAHEISGTSLDSGSHRDRIRELCLHLKEYKYFEKTKKDFFGEKTGSSIDFRLVLTLAVLRLEVAIQHCHSITLIGSNGCTLLPPRWAENESLQLEETNEES